MAKVVLALGSNLGDREAMLDFAVVQLRQLPHTSLLAVAERYDTTPVDVPEAFREMRFLNSAALLETALSPVALLEELHRIEAEAGRIRTVRNGPRPLDLDIILYEGVRSDTAELTLPHPHAHERDFVLRPLADLGITREMVEMNTISL